MKSKGSEKKREQLKASADKVLDMASTCIRFSQKESCGKCVPCRIGSKRMTEIMERMKNGEGRPGDIEFLERLGNHLKMTSLCAHGLSTGNTMLAMLGCFRDEFQFQMNPNQI